MLYRKTARARAVLAAHDRTLSLLERRVLILCDGRRDAGTLRALLGADALVALEHLQRAGYLELAPGAQRESPPPSDPGAADAPRPTMPAPVAHGAPRRSLAASRMYLLDMLQLQRDPEAATHAEAVRRSVEAEAMLEAACAALAYLRAAASPGVGARVAERLREIAPENWLPALEAAHEAAGKLAPPVA